MWTNERVSLLSLVTQTYKLETVLDFSLFYPETKTQRECDGLGGNEGGAMNGKRMRHGSEGGQNGSPKGFLGM